MRIRKPTPQVAVVVFIGVLIASVVSITGCAAHRNNNPAENGSPVVFAVEDMSGQKATALSFGYSYSNGTQSVIACGVAVWQGEYKDENTLIIDGEIWQNSITLSVENAVNADGVIYLPDGTVYDDGIQSPMSSISPLLRRLDSGTGYVIIAPSEPGEYIIEVTISWEKDNLEVTYGIKLIVTGQYSEYEKAFSIVWNHYGDALSVVFVDTDILHYTEYAGECYVTVT